MKEVKDIVTLKKLINEVVKICDKNISKAHNIDLEDMSQTLDSFLDQLNDIDDFETYDE
jgi:predicted translin family RNA/ssDNA-binding protein